MLLVLVFDGVCHASQVNGHVCNMSVLDHDFEGLQEVSKSIRGAFATRSPSGPKMAHEKSSRSLMLMLTAVFCSVRPICSAIDMKPEW